MIRFNFLSVNEATRAGDHTTQAGEALRGLQEGSRRRFGAEIGENPYAPAFPYISSVTCRAAA